MKPTKGPIVGVSGGTGREATQALTRDHYAAHVRWDGTAELPLMQRAGYGRATDGLTKGDEIDRDGCSVSGLDTFAGRFRLGLGDEMYDADEDVANDELTVVTGGVPNMIQGRSIDLKAER